MDFLIIAVVILFIVAFMSANSKKAEMKLIQLQIKRMQCPPHKWTYKKQIGADYEYMVCENCKMLPGGLYEEGNNVED